MEEAEGRTQEGTADDAGTNKPMQWSIVATQPETFFKESSPPTVQNQRHLLRTENVSVSFRSSPVLRNINISVQKGESIAIIGESGCGKTVLLKTLIRLFNPTEGKVLFDGKDLAQLSYFELAQTRTRYGFVFQQAALFDSMTVGENVAFPLVQHTQKTKEEILEIIVHLLEEAGLSADVIHKKPAELSGGMRKRVGFARALALEPELILYDEPTTGLDPIMSDVINDLMISARRQHNVTSIMVTHDMKSAFKAADRIIMLYPLWRRHSSKKTEGRKEEENQIVFDGTPEEMQNSDDKRVLQFIK